MAGNFVWNIYHEHNIHYNIEENFTHCLKHVSSLTKKYFELFSLMKYLNHRILKASHLQGDFVHQQISPCDFHAYI